tara:strand:+ start:86 stop:805 length:720 start_codon:yes stop_codon:yes gene_type:complete
MPKDLRCFRCDAEGVTREHFPPKAFFPKGANLQLRTVPSCIEHNNGKSQDDQYVLAHICMNAANGDNLAARRFQESIAPQLEFSPRFRKLLNHNQHPSPGRGVAYGVDTERFDRFFDSLCCAVFFDKYATPCGDEFKFMHHYMNFHSNSAHDQALRELGRQMHGRFFTDWSHMVSVFEADHVDEIVYGYEIVDPCGPDASITIAHSFYGVFQVVSLVTHKAANAEIEKLLDSGELDGLL